MFNIGPGELIVILIVALIVLGPEKLPEMAKTVGKGMRELRRATEDIKDQVESEFYKLDEDKPRPPLLRTPPGPRLAANAPQALPPVELIASTIPPAPLPPLPPESPLAPKLAVDPAPETPSSAVASADGTGASRSTDPKND